MAGPEEILLWREYGLPMFQPIRKSATIGVKAPLVAVICRADAVGKSSRPGQDGPTLPEAQGCSMLIVNAGAAPRQEDQQGGGEAARERVLPVPALRLTASL